ncbi:hypothetical protein [Actinomadura mexicana]|uniref:hypothetical protein n=1 Tax=Actinomadura mexicana TaxID=134959 RepID=UPI0015C5D570
MAGQPAGALTVHLDPADLPACAGQLSDYFTAHPDRYRFMVWWRLELAPEPGDRSGDAPGPYHHGVLGKIETIRRAQQAVRGASR